MAIPESRLEIWAHQGSITGSADTYGIIMRALIDRTAPWSSRSTDIYLQGSYANHTNVYGDSDVDVVLCLNATYHENIDALSSQDRLLHDADWTAATYPLAEFKADVAAWLAKAFGGVDATGKAIHVPASGSRRPVDVLACAEYRHYRSYSRPSSDDYASGICFRDRNGSLIENYPKQHSANCTAKHQATGGWFKPMVRVVKNLRNLLVSEGVIADGVAPSYFLEGMLSNVPVHLYGGSYGDTLANAIRWLEAADRSQLTCANGMHWLLRDGYPVCWREASYNNFLSAARSALL